MSGSTRLPDPNAPPEPAEEAPWNRNVLVDALIGLGVAGGLALVAVGGMTTRTSGATRSTRLEWQRRADLIQAAEARQAPSVEKTGSGHAGE
ncbi:MAG: hypothetical protein JW909_03340 [Planctomycetes bacterium]|nr:hypothetical protein [Planctomycetota bacterium]